MRLFEETTGLRGEAKDEEGQWVEAVEGIK